MHADHTMNLLTDHPLPQLPPEVATEIRERAGAQCASRAPRPPAPGLVPFWCSRSAGHADAWPHYACQDDDGGYLATWDDDRTTDGIAGVIDPDDQPPGWHADGGAVTYGDSVVALEITGHIVGTGRPVRARIVVSKLQLERSPWLYGDTLQRMTLELDKRFGVGAR